MDPQLRETVQSTRLAVKSLQRQARLVLQLTTDLEERLDALEDAPDTRIAQEAQRHEHTHRTTHV